MNDLRRSSPAHILRTQPNLGISSNVFVGPARLASWCPRVPRAHDVTPTRRIAAGSVNKIPIQQVNEAYERLIQVDEQYRFVIDRAVHLFGTKMAGGLGIEPR